MKRALDTDGLRELALAYVARYATSSGRLRSYCRRKLRERGFFGAEEGARPPDVDALVADFVDKGFVDDAGFAQARQDGLLSRGYGARRVDATLRADGIAEDLRADLAAPEREFREAAIAYARRRRFGPFARHSSPMDERHRQKQLAAMLRAGHSHTNALFVLNATNVHSLGAWVSEVSEEDEC